jgi:hypothetical protein
MRAISIHQNVSVASTSTMATAQVATAQAATAQASSHTRRLRSASTPIGMVAIAPNQRRSRCGQVDAAAG